MKMKLRKLGFKALGLTPRFIGFILVSVAVFFISAYDWCERKANA